MHIKNINEVTSKINEKNYKINDSIIKIYKYIKSFNIIKISNRII